MFVHLTISTGRPKMSSTTQSTRMSEHTMSWTYPNPNPKRDFQAWRGDDFTPNRVDVLRPSKHYVVSVPHNNSHLWRTSPDSSQPCRATATSSPFPFVALTTFSSRTQSDPTSPPNTTNTPIPLLATWRLLTSCEKMPSPLSSHTRVAYGSSRPMLLSWSGWVGNSQLMYVYAVLGVHTERKS